MTEIEKRAKQWATNYPKTPDATYTNNDIEAIAENSYIQGATDQKKIDIEKACKAFCEHTCMCSKPCSQPCDAILNVRKAMED